MLAVQVEGLTKSYGKVKAVDGISFSVEAGIVFGMLGPNGAGKTTTIETIIGLRQRDSGTVSVFGIDPSKNPAAIRNRIGVQLQTPAVFQFLTVREMVELFRSFYPNPLPASEVIEQVGLAEKARTQTRALSGGQLQRLAVALAIVSNGDIIFLDEPTTGLDPQARRGLWDVIRDLKRRGKTVFLTTHYMEEAERLCDSLVIIDQGRIIASGSPQELINEHFKAQALDFTSGELARADGFERLPGVTRWQVEENRVTLYTTDPAATLAVIFEQAKATGTAVQDITIRQASLEDVFLKLTGRRIRE